MPLFTRMPWINRQWMTALGMAALGSVLGLFSGCSGSKESSSAAISTPLAGQGPTPVSVSASTPTAGTTPAPTIRRATTPLDAGKLTISAARTIVYDSESGPITVVQDALPDCHCAGRSWWVKYYAGPTTGTAQREIRMTIDASGYIAEAEEINRTDKVEIVYTPPLVVIPDKLPAQTTGSAFYQQDVQMVVHPLGDRTRTRTSGRAHNQIHYLGDEPITTAAGQFQSRRLQATITADLSAATSINTTDQWWSDGVGLVLEKDHEITRALGLKVRENASTLVLHGIANPG